MTENPTAIQQRLQHLRRQIRTYVAVSGVARSLLAALAFCTASFLLDWWFNLASTTRLFLLLAGAVLIGNMVVRHVFFPLLLRLSDEDLALLIEKRFPELKESLISAVQLARDAGRPGPGTSAELIRAVLQQAESLAGRVDIDTVISFRRPSRWVAMAAIGIGLAGAFALQHADLAGVWGRRLVNPFTATRWPRKTQLELVGLRPTTRIGRGDDLTLTVAVTRGRVNRVFVDYAFASSRDRTRPLSVGPDGLFKTLFPRVNEPLRVRARAGDGETEWHRIDVVERPRIEEIQVQVEYPAYTRKPTEQLPEGQGDVQGVPGTAVRVVARSDRPVGNAQLAIQNGRTVPMALRSPTEASGSFALQLGQTAYRVEVFTEEGIGTPNPISFSLNVAQDQAPTIRLIQPASDQEFTAAASVSVTVQASDDYGIARTSLNYQTTQGTLGGAAGGAGEFIPPGIPAGAKKVETTFEWDLGALKLKEGDSTTFHLEAADADDVSGPNVGRTQECTIRIVARSKVESNLIARERQILRDMERLQKQQESARRDVDGLQKALQKEGRLNDKEQQEHLKTGLNQREILRSAEDLRDQAGVAMQYLRDNQIEDFERRDVLELMEETLRGLAAEELPEATRLIQEARNDRREETPDASKLAAAAGKQDSAVEKIQDLLAKAGQADELDQAIHRTRLLANRQEQLNEQTRRLAVDLLGKSGGQLSEEETQKLRNLGADQERGAEQLKEIEQQVADLAAKWRDEKPQVADALNAALSEARKDQIRSEMSRAAERIQNNLLLSVLKPQQQVHENLQELVAGLKKSREAKSGGLAELKAQMRQALEELGDLARNQAFLLEKSSRAEQESREIQQLQQGIGQLRKDAEGLGEQTRDAERTAEDKKAEALGRLAWRQEEIRQSASSLGQRAQELATRMSESSGYRSDKLKAAAAELGKASELMDTARQSLVAGKPAAARPPQGEADARLQDAMQRVDEAGKNLKEELSEALPGLADPQRDYSSRTKRSSEKLAESAKSDEARKNRIDRPLTEASQSLEQTIPPMESAQEQLKQSDPAKAGLAQQEATQGLAKAMEQVAQAFRTLLEDERQKKIARLQAEVERMIRAQSDINSSVRDVDRLTGPGAETDRATVASRIESLAKEQGRLIDASQQLKATFESETVLVFAWVMDQIVELMSDIRGRLEGRQTDWLTQDRGDAVVRELGRLLALLNQSQSMPSPSQAAKPKEKEPGQSSSGEDSPLIPPLAELKMLRDVELELYQATKALDAERVIYPQRPLAAWKTRRLEQMADRQGELARLARRLGLVLQERRNRQGNSQ